MGDFFSAVSCLLHGGWLILSGFTFPGTSITAAQVLIGTFCAVVSLRIIGYVLGVNYNLGTVTGFVGRHAQKKYYDPNDYKKSPESKK